MQTDMHDSGLDEAHIQRCLNAFWTVYILDRQMSSLMGVPLALKDSEISSQLPTFPAAPQKSMALQLHVRLSKTIAQILNSELVAEMSQLILTTSSSLWQRGQVDQEIHTEHKICSEEHCRDNRAAERDI